jgi:hypothetical protein
MQRDDGVLPTLAAMSTPPIVLGDGFLLATDRLDPKRGIAFIIDPS